MRRTFLAVLATGHGLNSIAGGFVYPFLAVYFGRRSGVGQGAIAVGTVFALSTVLSAAGRIVGGEMADRHGRRLVLLASIGSRSLLLLMMAAAVWRGEALALVALPFLLSAISRGAYEPAADAMVADVIPAAERPRAYALMRIGRNAGWAIGPALGGLAGEARFAELTLAASMLGILNLALSARLLRETPHTAPARPGFDPRDLALVAADPVFGRLCLLTAGQFILFSQLLLSVAIDLASRAALSSFEIGAIYTLNGVMVVLLQAIVTRAASEARTTRALAMGALLYGAGLLVIGAARGTPAALAGMAVFTVGEMIAMPLSAALAADIAPADRRGRYLGVFGLFMDVGHGLGQVLGGFGLALAAAQPLYFWWSLMAFAAVLAAGYLRFEARLRPR